MARLKVYSMLKACLAFLSFFFQNKLRGKMTLFYPLKNKKGFKQGQTMSFCPFIAAEEKNGVVLSLLFNPKIQPTLPYF